MCIRDRLQTGSRVASLRVEDGRVRGLVLADGTDVDAPLVLSAADPRATLLELLPPGWLPLRVERGLRRIRARGTTAVLWLALSELPPFAGRPGARIAHARLVRTLDDLERTADALKYDRLVLGPPKRGRRRRRPGELDEARLRGPWLELGIPSLGRPGLAPEGAHVLVVHAHGVPESPAPATRRAAAGWTDARRRDLRKYVLAALEEVLPGLGETVQEVRVLTPPDLAAAYGIPGGHLHHAEPALDQLWALRPIPACARYATPVEGLFLCGGGSHPGAAFRCGAGVLGAGAALAAS